MTAKRTGITLLVLFLLLGGAVVCGLAWGSAPLDFGTIVDALSGRGDDTARIILFELRLPRVGGALLAGAGLAVCGLLLQTVTGNDLCSPNIIGVNAGAGLAVMVILCLFPMAFRLLPLAAFVGALATTLTVLGISASAGGHSTKTTVVLAGVAVGALLNAGISFLSSLYPDALASYTAFSVGGFSGVYADDLPLPGLLILAGILVAWCLSPRLNLLCLGDELARSLGVRVQALRLLCLILASALCAAVVTFAGLLGFVGLVVPHITRRLVGHDLRILVPAGALLGALLTVVADLAGRTLFSPAELPAGILLSALGAPFFLFLLFKRRRAYDA